MSYRSFSLAVASLTLGIAALNGCAAADSTPENEVEDVGDTDSAASDLTTSEKDRLCNAVTFRPWTAAESDALLRDVVARFIKLKRDNDALIRTRGIGQYVGVRAETYKASEAGRRADVIARIAPRIKDGSDPSVLAQDIRGTSCIGRVYSVLRSSYATIGRSSEWAAIEKCGRAWDSDGLNVQRALIKNGWGPRALGMITDANTLLGSTTEQDLHRGLLRGITRGSYYGVPMQSTALKNFMPSAGGSTPLDEKALLRLGRSKFLAFGTLRAAYHVPLIVPAAYIPSDLAPASGSARTEWLNAKTRGEPFVMESHSLREIWDPTNFEIRPLRAVIAETLDSDAKYQTGTLLFAPFSQFTM